MDGGGAISTLAGTLDDPLITGLGNGGNIGVHALGFHRAAVGHLHQCPRRHVSTIILHPGIVNL